MFSIDWSGEQTETGTRDSTACCLHPFFRGHCQGRGQEPLLYRMWCQFVYLLSGTARSSECIYAKFKDLDGYRNNCHRLPLIVAFLIIAIRPRSARPQHGPSAVGVCGGGSLKLVAVVTHCPFFVSR